MRQCNKFKYDIDKEIISREKIGHKLKAQEFIITKLRCVIDKYKPRNDSY